MSKKTKKLIIETGLDELIRNLVEQSATADEIAQAVRDYITDKVSNLKVAGMGRLESSQVSVASDQLEADKKALESL